MVQSLELYRNGVNAGKRGQSTTAALPTRCVLGAVPIQASASARTRAGPPSRQPLLRGARDAAVWGSVIVVNNKSTANRDLSSTHFTQEQRLKVSADGGRYLGTVNSNGTR